MSPDLQNSPLADTEPTTPPPSRRRGRWLLAGVVLILLVTVVVGRATGGEDRVDVRDGTTVVSAAGLAARYGIDVSLLAVTAAGGMVELRFQVVDPDKAAGLLADRSKRPVLVVEDSGATLAMSSPPHVHQADLELGETYFLLLANAHSAVAEGSLVTLVLGDVRIEHVRAVA